MPVIDLQLKAQLTNVTALVPDEAEGAYDWHFKMQCGTCKEVTEKFVTINDAETRNKPGSRGEANLVMRCKFCKREGAASILDRAVEYTGGDSGEEFATILSIECRGMEPVAFEPRGGWTAKGVDSNMRFEFDLDEGEWYGYDEKAGIEVSVADIEHRFQRGHEPKRAK
ncbi:hypothetical protein H4R18_001958 [Coemansia javaensis]|uniref:DUF866-domain-containing protein n=1 Tax=Coemansia javaensis TaxID=2761396 RepID=A0A9W8HB57_9FUNG|nr:hypothetical protein H4R18_001958 [Coemansia javaensis]